MGKLVEGNRYAKITKSHNDVYHTYWIEKTFEQDRYRILVPKTCVKMVYDAFHNLNHPGTKGTFRLIADRFYWPTIRKDVAALTKCCLKCQVNKFSRSPVLPIQKIGLPEIRFHTIHADLIGPLKPHKGYQHVLCIRDRFTKYNELIPLRSATAIETFEQFVARHVGTFGLPKILITDNGGNFKSDLVKYFTNKLAIKHKFTTPHHPASNGFQEAPNKIIKYAIKTMNQDIWSDCIPFVQLMINNVSTDQNNYTPAQMVFGSAQRLPSDLFLLNSTVPTEAWSNEQIRNFILTMFELNPLPIVHNRINPKVFIFNDLKKCQSVWLKNMNKTSKMDPNYVGPYKVINRFEKYFEIEDERGHLRKYNIELLKPSYSFNPKLWE